MAENNLDVEKNVELRVELSKDAMETDELLIQSSTGEYYYDGVKTDVTLFVPIELRHLTHLQNPIELAYQQEVVQLLRDQPQSEYTQELLQQCDTIHKRELLALEKKQIREQKKKQKTTDNKKKKFIWNTRDDILLLREVVAREPFNAPHGKVKSAWEGVIGAIEKHLVQPVEVRSGQDRFNRLMKSFKGNQLDSMKKSGEFYLVYLNY